MRKQVKEKIMETLLKLEQKQIKIARAVSEGRGEEARSLLAECQETAIRIGNTVEADETGHPSVIRRLEEYCELLYRQSMAAEEGVFHGELDASLAIIKEAVNTQIAGKLEVVFFPYKASMWDSLESVYEAAERDGECDAYVVPIPYFDKNPDGTVSGFHYEGDGFPNEIPIVHWEAYDVAARRPDVIYIHNPYDQANKVTSVHPDYYAKELRKHTKRLVYIPYFVCLNDCVQKELCVLPGTMYADRVIVQSEKTREVYIEEFHKFEDEYNCRGRFGSAEEKFVALGSPKYDKVVRTAKEGASLPGSWEKKIKKPDGGRRKVLLYNTSLVQLLNGKEKCLEKIEAVLALLRGREDVTLLWRPHPLSGTTYDAMQPELSARYRRIVENYKKEDWGIYDDTPDLHRAIAVSDAYYGDMSSLVELYRMTGKPILIQNVETP